MATEQRKTNCHFCGYLCAFTATVEDGRITALEPDASRYPYDPQVLAGCRRWPMNLEVLDGADRVNRPLRRVGERGSGAWEEVSWDEALDDIAARLAALAAEHGPGTLASMIGGPHTSFWPLHRFMTLFGSPNNMGIGQICWNPRIWMDVLTFGWTVEADIADETGCVVIWGTNPAESDNSLFWRTLLKIGRSDVPLVVVDPRYTRTAVAADIWLAPVPGTDCALALGMLNVIIAEDLIDRAFVEEWCHGFDELAAHVAPWTPEAAAAECGVDAEDIRRVARLFAGPAPSALVSGRGIDQVGRSVAPTHRAICCLRALTGNVDRPGACVLAEGSDFVPEVDLELTLEHADELAARCLNTGVTPLQSYEGYARVAALTERMGRKLPARYLTSAHPDLVLRAMETGEPYPVRALIVEATNPLLTYADTHRVFAALSGLDLIVVLDYYLTPTASLADYVLPAAGAMERPTFQAHGGVANIAYGGPAACAPYYERKVDYEVFRELGLRLGQEGAWPGHLRGGHRRHPRAMRHGLGDVLRAGAVLPAAGLRQASAARPRRPGPGLRHRHGQDRAGERGPGRPGRPAPARARRAAPPVQRRLHRRARGRGLDAPAAHHRRAQAALQRLDVLQQRGLPPPPSLPRGGGEQGHGGRPRPLLGRYGGPGHRSRRGALRFGYNTYERWSNKCGLRMVAS